MNNELQSHIQSIREKVSEQGNICFVSGNFNVIHPGHQRLISFAADCAEVLVVGIHPDDNPGVMFPQEARIENIRQLSRVNEIIALDGNLIEVLKELKPAFVVKGNEHKNTENVEAEVLSEYGGKLLFGSGDLKYSSVDMISSDFESIDSETLHKPLEYLNRHNVSYHQISHTIEKFKDIRVAVIGDVIIDNYITCNALGMSQEDPTLVVTPIMNRKFLGGAGVVASHAKSLGADTTFLSVLGNDEGGEFVQSILKERGVDSFLLQDPSRPTILKERYRTQDKTLLRVNHLRQHAITADLCEMFFTKLEAEISNVDLLIFSDFNYGCLPQDLVDRVTQLGVKNKVMMVADSQSSSQVGDITRFKNMDLITPTEREARLGVSDFQSGLTALCNKVRHRAECKHIFTTLGAEGTMIQTPDSESPTFDGVYTDRLFPLNKHPRDTAGAGDSLLVTSALALATGANIWEAAYIGSLAAAVQIKRLGNIPLQPNDLLKETLV